ncbi:hypothetical protein VEZ01S_17_00200 [Vibrio ezurae NBRC 102218]|uniref:Uncharacterized protein n=1 Tax=Vibrio ezurae NBRC 102218 TaxID=1219080 RepID=U3CN64_9VIBR|nr:hypothetical protein VEZ01S_17_00200 [Vibrio ezurae NBRC 102218]
MYTFTTYHILARQLNIIASDIRFKEPKILTDNNFLSRAQGSLLGLLLYPQLVVTKKMKTQYKNPVVQGWI